MRDAVCEPLTGSSDPRRGQAHSRVSGAHALEATRTDQAAAVWTRISEIAKPVPIGRGPLAPCRRLLPGEEGATPSRLFSGKGL